MLILTILILNHIHMFGCKVDKLVWGHSWKLVIEKGHLIKNLSIYTQLIIYLLIVEANEADSVLHLVDAQLLMALVAFNWLSCADDVYISICIFSCNSFGFTFPFPFPFPFACYIQLSSRLLTSLQEHYFNMYIYVSATVLVMQVHDLLKRRQSIQISQWGVQGSLGSLERIT